MTEERFCFRDLVKAASAAPVMHRNDDPGLQLLPDLVSLVAVYRIKTADRDEQSVAGTDLRGLFVAQKMPEIPEVDDVHAFRREDVDQIAAALRALAFIVETGDRTDRERALARVFRDPDAAEIIVIKVTVARVYRVRRGICIRKSLYAIKRIYYQFIISRLQGEAGMTVPCDLHTVILSACMPRLFGLYLSISALS